MKTLFFASLLVILVAVFANGCQEDTPSEPVINSMYLKKTNGDGQYCKYKVYENFKRETVIDTICILCASSKLDSMSNRSCANEKDFRFVWDQEYHRDDSSMTWRPLYIEKLPMGFLECSDCPSNKKTYIRTYYGDETR